MMTNSALNDKEVTFKWNGLNMYGLQPGETVSIQTGGDFSHTYAHKGDNSSRTVQKKKQYLIPF